MQKTADTADKQRVVNADSPALRLRLLRELAQRLRWGGLSYALFAFLFSLNLAVPGRRIALWLCGLLAVAGVLRTLASHRVTHCSETEREGARLLRISRLQSVIFALFVAYALWIVRGVVLFECLVVVGVAGLSSVSASLFAPFPRLARLHVSAQVVPVYIWSAFAMPRFGWLLCAFMVIHVLAVFQLIRLDGAHIRRMFLDQLMLEEQSHDLRCARDAAETADSAKMTFLANMSHEIRTPLNGIMGLSEVLNASNLAPEQRELLDDICRSGAHLLSIVNDILDIAKVTSGKLTLEQLPFDFMQLIRDLASPATALAEARQLDFHLEMAPDLPRYVKGDPVRIRQVVSNLLSNAVKFTPTGSVRLSVEIPRSGWVRFRVADTGIGLSPEQQLNLFQEFHQVDSSTTRKFGGTGLGLAISHRLVTLMDGMLGVESRLGTGATFIVELPLPSASLRATAQPESNVPEVRLPPGFRVLVAEDNVINRKVVCAIVSRAGAKVDVAENGREAVEHHRASPYDMILMDCQMPVLDGYEATAAIRSLPGKAAQVTIIGVTANAFTEDRDRCLGVGMNGYVAKPLTPQSLLIAMSEHIPEATPAMHEVS